MVEGELGKLAKSGQMPPRGARIIVELGCTAAWGQHAIDKFPCITATRGQHCDFWIADLGRKATLDELMRLQGFNPRGISYKKAGVNKKRVGHMVGNAMSMRVLERLLPPAMRAMGLPPPCRADRWADLVQGLDKLTVSKMRRLAWRRQSSSSAAAGSAASTPPSAAVPARAPAGASGAR